MLSEDAKKLGIHNSQKGTDEWNEGNAKEVLSTADGLKPVLVEVDLKDLKFPELKKLAKDEGLEVPRSTSKEALVEILQNHIDAKQEAE